MGGRPTTIASLATYVPPRAADQRRPREDGRDDRRVDPAADRHPRAPHRRSRASRPRISAREAALKAIANAGLTPDDIGVIVVGTVTPDMMFPSTACLIQHKIGAQHAWGFDLSAACSAFTYSLTTASQLVASGAHEHALVVGADVMSSIIDYTGSRDLRAVRRRRRRGGRVARRSRATARSSTSSTRSTAAAGRRCACRPAAACKPSSHETVDQRLHYVKQDGQTVFKFAVRKTEEICAPHPRAQRPRRRPISTCSSRIRRIAASSSRRPRSSASIRARSIINIERFGNTTAATIPLALNDAIASGRLKKGNLVLLASVGAGFTVGAVLLRWGF